jgi:hypothetical protein
MALNYVTLICDLGAGQGYYLQSGTAALAPSAVLTDSADHLIVSQVPVPVTFSDLGPPQVRLLATDNAALLPSGWAWTITPPAGSGIAAYSFFLPFSGGATQYLSALSPVSSVTTMQAYMPLPAGTPSAGQVPAASGSGEASAWTTLTAASVGADASGAAAAAQANAEAYAAALVPLTTKGDLLYENATPAPARLPIGSAGQVLGLSGGVPAWSTGMTLLAATPVTGYTLVNGTGTILTWTAPADGNMHRVLLTVEQVVTSLETGGAVTWTYKTMDGTSHVPTVLAGGSAAGASITNAIMYLVPAGVTVTLAQSSALSAGAATVWAEIWGS